MTDAFVQAARDWIGTPYLHQAATKGVGCDCLGLVIGVWRDVFGHIPETVPAYTSDWAEPQGDELLFAAASRHMQLVKTTDLTVGQVVLFRMRDDAVAKHLGIISRTAPHAHFIHSYTGHGVVESPLSTPWRKRIAARFAVLEG